MKRRLGELIVVLAALSGVALGADVPEEMKGTWKLNHDESMELMKTYPKYEESQRESISRGIKSLEARMSLSVTGSSLTVGMGKRKQSLAFTVVSATKTEVTAKSKAGHKEFELKLKLIKGKYLQMISSASDDMNYYAWEKKQ